MVQNKIGFASRKCYGIEPDYYRNIGGSWNAIYLIGDGEYHISLNPEFYNHGVVRDIDV